MYLFEARIGWMFYTPVCDALRQVIHLINLFEAARPLRSLTPALP